ncbi:MAG: SDR family oxidoreductase [Desulfosarcinaceae bacterium]|nr:SDR family oxidoreductase [Desulfosarcinaceae bacterium]
MGNYVVIGASSGIGLRIAQDLIAEGHHIWASSRSGSPSPSAAAANWFAFDAHSDSFPADSLPATINGLVYCPGTVRLKPLRALKESDFTADFQLNVMGAVAAIKAGLSGLKKCDSGGSIVLFSSVVVQTGMPFHASVACAKGAIEGLARNLAAELAPRIRVNAIAPSLTDTPLAAHLLSDDAKRSAAAQRHPLKRVGTPEEMARAAVFLLGPQSGWITGQVIPVDGGMGSVRTFK